MTENMNTAVLSQGLLSRIVGRPWTTIFPLLGVQGGI